MFAAGVKSKGGKESNIKTVKIDRKAMMNSNNDSVSDFETEEENSSVVSEEESPVESLNATSSVPEEKKEVQESQKKEDDVEEIEIERTASDEESGRSELDSDSEVSSEDEEVIDIRQNTLYQVLACLLEDEKGDNLVEVLVKINEGFERHNQHLESLMAKLNDNENKLCDRFDKQNSILEKMATSFDTYLNKRKLRNNNNNNNNDNNNNNNDENEL